jgi:hypothetical protein
VGEKREPLLLRLHRAFGPLAGGIILDVVDLATFGPIGLCGGFLLGGLVGWWIGSLYSLSVHQRRWLAAAAALYTAIPLTEPLPIATAFGAFARFQEKRTAGDRASTSRAGKQDGDA